MVSRTSSVIHPSIQTDDDEDIDHYLSLSAVGTLYGRSHAAHVLVMHHAHSRSNRLSMTLSSKELLRSTQMGLHSLLPEFTTGSTCTPCSSSPWRKRATTDSTKERPLTYTRHGQHDHHPYGKLCPCLRKASSRPLRSCPTIARLSPRQSMYL